ncbi:MAG: DUF3011 domain-containing protein [Pseudoxanthomonas sp.]
MKLVWAGCVMWMLMASAPAPAEPPAASGMRFRCESDRTQQRYCEVDTREGITLVKQLSKTPCMQGRNWDYDRHGVWVSHRCRGEFVVGKPLPVEEKEPGTVVRCESRSRQVERCPADTRNGVRLTRLLSASECVENQGWGYDEEGIWTARGCRAEFRVGSSQSGRGSVAPIARESARLVCESNGEQRARCDVRVAKGVDLLRQLSKTRCVKDDNWGWDSTGIWVDKGCRAEFGVH